MVQAFRFAHHARQLLLQDRRRIELALHVRDQAFKPLLVLRQIRDLKSIRLYLPVQLANLAAKLRARTSAAAAAKVALHHTDSTALAAADATYDQVLLFFLLHEQPEEARQKTLFEAWRVLKPGGRMVLVDYHEPYDRHPLKPVMRYVLTRIEPYAIDLWRVPLTHWLPPEASDAITARSAKVTWFGGLYQQLIITK